MTFLFTEASTLPQLIYLGHPLTVSASIGSDTTSVVFSALFFYLSRYPQVYAKVVAEVRNKFPDRSSIQAGSSLESCVYLHACLSEAMRMSPPTSGSPWREVEQGGALVAGKYFPCGYDVGCCLYAVHHNESYFPDSFRFMPERWIESELTISPEQRQLAVDALKPFSLGPRACAGRSLAMLELSLTTAKILWALDFRRAKGPSGNLGEGKAGGPIGRHRIDEYQLISHITSSGKGPRLQFRHRNFDAPSSEKK